MQKTIIILLFILLTFDANAQSIKERVKAMFSDSTATVQMFRGRMNDMNDVFIALGSDGTDYKGIMKYFRSETEFLLEGRVNDKTLSLTEKDTLGQRTGQIQGTIDEFEGIKAEWNTYGKKVGFSMQLIPYTYEPVYPTYCGDNKWIRAYTGLIGDEVVDFILERGANFQIDGTAYFNNQKKSYTIRGDLTNYQRNISLELTDNNYNIIGKIEAEVNFSSENIKGTFTDSNKHTFDCSFSKGETISMGCSEFADFATAMFVTYPKTKNVKFNEWMNEYIQDWQSSARAYTRQFQQQMPRLTPFMRASLRSYFWFDLSFYSSQLISGKATHTNTWESGYQGQSFTFDFTNNKRITLVDIFDKNSNYQQFIKDYIRKDLENRNYYNEPAFQKWLINAKFEHFTILQEGINFSSDFNSLFGAQHCTIPYEDLKPFLKKESVVNGFVN